MIDGDLEVTIDGVAQIARAGLVAIMPSNVRHSVKALTGGRLSSIIQLDPISARCIPRRGVSPLKSPISPRGRWTGHR